jgi:soluble lytic murein transglycosylase-like protein
MNRALAFFAGLCVVALWVIFPPTVKSLRVVRIEPEPIAITVPDIERTVYVLPAVHVPVTLPPASYRYRHSIERAAQRAFTRTDAPVALLAAQIFAESNFQAAATSNKGAAGVAQFMPATAAMMGARYPEFRPVNPRDADWAIRAQALHMRDLYQLYPAASTECDRWALALCSYNGPPQLCQREQSLASNPNIWFGSVEDVRVKGRGIAAYKGITLVRAPHSVAD